MTRISTLLLATYSLLTFSSTVSAFPGEKLIGRYDISCSERSITVSGLDKQIVADSTDSIDISINAPLAPNNVDYQLFVYDADVRQDTLPFFYAGASDVEEKTDSTVEFTLTGNSAFNLNFHKSIDPLTTKTTKHVFLYKEDEGGDCAGLGGACSFCKLGTYEVVKEGYACEGSLIYQERVVGDETRLCYAGETDALCTNKEDPITIVVEGVKNNSTGKLVDPSFRIAASIGGGMDAGVGTYVSPGKFEWTVPQSNFTSNDITVGFSAGNGFFNELDDSNCKKTFKRSASCNENACTDSPSGPNPINNSVETFKLCSQINDDALRTQCESCAEGEAGQAGVWTAVGCIKRDPVKIAERLIQVGLGMGGGVALIMTLAGGFILSTSQGDPQKANQAKEMITNSVIGLLFVIFSVVILQFIGVTILNIPGFGESTQ